MNGLDIALADDEVRVIVLTHTGPVFCAGMDLKESRGAAAEKQGVNEFPAILNALWNSPKPIVAKLAGPARAGGIGIVAACDIVVAAETATFAFTEVRIGVVPAVISLTVLPRLTPRAAHRFFLTGETFGAAQAEAIGLINAAVPVDRLEQEIRRFVDALLLGAPDALTGVKDLLRRPRASAISDDMDEMNRLSARYFAGNEGQEGMRAFAEKRTPAWVLASP
jgi:methylglutaconyl-CoA hydratase